MRGVNTYGLDSLDQQVQCEYVYTIFSGYILPNIMSNNDGKSKEEAGDVDITEHMIYAISRTFPEYGRIIARHPEIVCEKHNIVEAVTLDKLKPTHSIDVDYWNDKRFAVINKFYNLSVYFIIKEDREKDRLFNDLSVFKKDSICNSFFKNIDGSSLTELAFHPVLYFDNSNELYNLKKWEYITNINESVMMSSDKHSSLLGKINDYNDTLNAEAYSKIEEKLSEALKPFFERLCGDIEMMLKKLISLNISTNEKSNITKGILPDERKIKKLLTEKAESTIFDFEVVDYFLRKHRKDDYVNALFIMLQNLLCDVTDFFNDTGAELSAMLSTMLSKERFKKHISVMKRRLNSNDLKHQKELEARLYKERKDEYKKPESVRDMLFTKHPYVYNGLYNAIAEYINQLNHIDSKDKKSD